MLPDVPAVVAEWTLAATVNADGEAVTGLVKAIAPMVTGAQPIVCHMQATATRLRVAAFPAHDVLELFAFVRPAQFCLPTVAGITQALGLEHAPGLENSALALVAAARYQLDELTAIHEIEAKPLGEIAAAMARAGDGRGVHRCSRP